MQFNHAQLKAARAAHVAERERQADLLKQAAVAQVQTAVLQQVDVRACHDAYVKQYVETGDFKKFDRHGGTMSLAECVTKPLSIPNNLVYDMSGTPIGYKCDYDESSGKWVCHGVLNKSYFK
jgi:hypothetical protein